MVRCAERSSGTGACGCSSHSTTMRWLRAKKGATSKGEGMNPLRAASRFFEHRYGIVLHWTLYSVPQPPPGDGYLAPTYHENIQGLVRWLWWDVIAKRFCYLYELCSIPMSHDVFVIQCGPWLVAFRRAGAKFQLNDQQHSRWLPVRIKLPFFNRVYRGGWLNEYMGTPPIEDIAPGFTKPYWYEPS